MKWKVRTLILLALLVSLGVIFTRFSIMVLPSVRIGFRDVPIILAGILFGPVAGMVTGIAADLIGFLVGSTGAFFYGFTISAALVGLIPGLVFMGEKRSQYPIVKIILAVVLVEMGVSLFLNTYWLTVMLGKAFWSLLPLRVLARIIITPLEVLILTAVIRALHKANVNN